MDALSSLDRTVVWRFDLPSRTELETFSKRLAADLANPGPAVPARPFLIVTPAGLHGAEDLERQLAIRCAAVVEKRAVDDWPRAASALYARGLDHDRVLRAFAFEALWRGLFPRGGAEVWLLEDERAFERAWVWKPALRGRVRGVQVTVQGLFESFEAGLHAFHVPDAADLEREWRVLASVRVA